MRRCVILFVDTHEPQSIYDLLGQSISVNKPEPGLNKQGYADYLWFGCDGHRIQVERKQIDEILSGMDSVEEQLQRELSNGVEETILLIERFCEPVPRNSMAVQTYTRPSGKLMALLKKILKHDNVLVVGHVYNVSYVGLQAWKNQLDKAGITIVETTDWLATVSTLVALYNNSQKPEHTTLRRYIKDRIITTERNPHVLTLMGIKNGGVGEEIAKALIGRFGTAHYTLTQDIETLAETMVGDDPEKQKRFGAVRARKLLRAFGRQDV